MLLHELAVAREDAISLGHVIGPHRKHDDEVRLSHVRHADPLHSSAGATKGRSCVLALRRPPIWKGPPTTARGTYQGRASAGECSLRVDPITPRAAGIRAKR